MKDNLIIRRYAKAFFNYTLINNKVDDALTDLETVAQVLNENKELRTLLAEPFVSIAHKINIINKLFDGKISSVTIEFLNLMIRKKRDAYIQFIYQPFKDLYHENKGISIVTVTSAVKLDDTTLEKIVVLMKDVVKGKIQIENVVNKGIIGGFIINHQDYQYDASIKTSMNRLHKIFEQNLFVKGY